MCDIKMKPQAEKKSQSRLMRPLIGIIVVAVLVLGVAAFIVHLFSPQIPSLITADGMLSYIGSGISSVATILLAVIAYKQTERANQMADKLAQQSNLFAEQANELSKQANNAAKKANDLAEESYKVAQKSNDLAAQSNEAAKQSNKLAELSLQATQRLGGCAGLGICALSVGRAGGRSAEQYFQCYSRSAGTESCTADRTAVQWLFQAEPDISRYSSDCAEMPNRDGQK